MNQIATAPLVAAASAGAAGESGEVAAQGMSTAQLARQIGEGRQADENKDDPADKGDAVATEGQPPAKPKTASDLNTDAAAEAAKAEAAKAAAMPLAAKLQTLKLSPTALAAVTEVFTKGGDLDAAALGLTDAQVAGLEKIASETTGEPEAAAPVEETLDLSKDTRLNPEQKAHVGELFKDRIGKVIAKERGAAEAKVNEAKAAQTAAEQQAQELRTQLEARPNAAPASIPLGDVTSQEQLATRATQAKDVKRWTTQNLNRLTRAPEAVEAEFKANNITLPEYSVDAMEAWLTEAQTRAEQTISEDVPARAQYLKDEASGNQNAARMFPDLEKTDTQFGKDAQLLLRNFPEIKKVPHWKVIQGVVATGMAAMRAKDAATAAAAATSGKPKINILPRTKVPKVIVRSGAAPRTTPGEAAETEAENTFRTTGSTASLAKMFASKRK